VRPADIGARLHVDRLLEGSIQRVGGHVHVTTQLVDARTLDQIWARRYDAPETDMLTVEGRIAEEVVMSLKGAVLDEDMSSLRLGGTTNPQAYDSDLSGLVAMNAVNTGADRQAIESFDRAIAADPGYAEAYAQRAQAATFLAVNGGAKDSAESTALLAAAAADAEHAVQLAPELAAAHVALGSVLRFQLSDLAHAAQAYQRAMELAPQDPYIIMHYALMQAELGHSAPALDAARRAVALDPLQPTNYRFLAEVLLDAGQYDDALTALHHARNLQPIDLDMDRIALALVQLAKGDMQGAEKTCGGAKDFYDFACLAVADHAVGNQVAALAALGKLSAMLGDQGAYNYAGIYAAWGQQDTAIHWLQRAYALRDPGLTHIKIESSLRPLHGTKAYQDIVRALKFPP
jgi:serine/threonine-protein kinase